MRNDRLLHRTIHEGIAMKKEMLINVAQAEECRIAILENGLLEELYVERTNQESLVGNIYKGKVVNIEPSIQAAFVDFGVGRNGFLHISDVEPIYFKLAENKGRLPERPDRMRNEGAAGQPQFPPPVIVRGERMERPDFDTNFSRGPSRPPLPPKPPVVPETPVPPPPPVPDGFSAGIDYDVVAEPSTPAPIVFRAVPSSPPSVVVSKPTPPPAPPLDPGGFADGLELDDPVQTPPPAPVLDNPVGTVPPAQALADPAPTPAPAAEPASTTSTARLESPVIAAPGTEIVEEETAKPRRKSRSTTPRKKKTTTEEPTNSEEPKPKLMDSAERRTEEGEEGNSLDDDLLFFPLSKSEPESPAVLPTEPEPTLPPPVEEVVVIAPVEHPRRRRPLDMPRSIEAALEADLAAAEIGLEQSPDVMMPIGEPQIEDIGVPERMQPVVAGAVDDDFDDNFDEDGASRRRSSGGGRDFRNGRGGPPRRAGNDRFSSRTGPSRPRMPIQEVFKRGQEVIIQVIKEGIGTKGPTLSTFISIPGRYLVLMPYLNRTGVSRKIEDEEARRRLRQMFNELRPPQGLGFIMRTAAIDKNKREVQRDLVYLSRLWQVIAARIKKVKAPCNIYQESEMVTRTIRDNFTSDIDVIWIDEKKAFEAAQEFMQAVMPRYADRLKFYDSKEPLFHRFKIEEELSRIQMKKIPLPMGGSIVIEQTEALVAIDVNSGNFRADGNNAEETAYQMNLHAAKEIARQLRLRDLGGVIVNDFIDMRDEKHRRNVERALRDAMRRDRARTKILRISQFGIIEMTRQRIRPGLRRAGYIDCPHCKTHGMVKSPETMAIELMRMLQLASCREPIHQVDVVTCPEVADYLLNRRRKEILAMEEVGAMTVTIRGMPGVPPEHLHFACLDHNGNEVRLIVPEPVPFRPRR